MRTLEITKEQAKVLVSRDQVMPVHYKGRVSIFHSQIVMASIYEANKVEVVFEPPFIHEVSNTPFNLKLFFEGDKIVFLPADLTELRKLRESMRLQ